jgi:hypothetical protein
VRWGRGPRRGPRALAQPQVVCAVVVVGEARGEGRGPRVVVSRAGTRESVPQPAAPGEGRLVELPDAVQVAFHISLEHVDCAWDGEELVVDLQAELDGGGGARRRLLCAVAFGCLFFTIVVVVVVVSLSMGASRGDSRGIGSWGTGSLGRALWEEAPWEDAESFAP